MGKGLEEREINLWDMFWAVCLKWRSILACAVIFAILAGGFSYVGSLQEIKSESNLTVVTTEDLYEGLTYEEQKTSDVYFDFKKTYDELNFYNENAPLMQLNANDFYKGEVSFYVDNFHKLEYPIISESNNIVAMVSAYKAAVGTEEFAAKVKEIFDESQSTSYALEMVDCYGLYGESSKINNQEPQGVFSIMVYGQDEETCSALMGIVRDAILASKDDIFQEFGKHDLIVLKDMMSKTSSSALLEEQKKNIELAHGCSNAMYNLSKNFSEAQSAYVDKRLADIQADGEEYDVIPKTELSPSINKKMLIIGFVVGVFIAFCIWIFDYILTVRIRLEDDFESVFNCKLLGNVPVSDKKRRKWFWFIDNMFIKLRHLNQRYFSQEDALDMIAANVRIATSKTDARKIVITGAVSGKDEKVVAEALADRLKKDNIELLFNDSILYNAESMECLNEIGQAILLEKAGQSLYSEIAKEIAICEQQEVNLIGCVVIY